jgi:hypothetical protein
LAPHPFKNGGQSKQERAGEEKDAAERATLSDQVVQVEDFTYITLANDVAPPQPINTMVKVQSAKVKLTQCHC